MQRSLPHPPHSPANYDEAHYRATFRDAPYYSVGRYWRDYAPAYLYGHLARDEHPGERFDEVEPQLARDWPEWRDDSRLLWAEARGAVRDAWQHHDDVDQEPHRGH